MCDYARVLNFCIIIIIIIINTTQWQTAFSSGPEWSFRLLANKFLWYFAQLLEHNTKFKSVKLDA